MANKTVAQLATLSGIADADLIPIYDTSEAGSEKLKHISGQDFKSDLGSDFSPTSHTHTESDVTDLDKYTQSEVNTISGTLQTDIDGKLGSTEQAVDSDKLDGLEASQFLRSDVSTVFNEDGGDIDFRIEGDNETNLFFTDASEDRVGIGTDSPSADLEVADISSPMIVINDTNNGFMSLSAVTGSSDSAIFFDNAGDLKVRSQPKPSMGGTSDDTTRVTVQGDTGFFGIGTDAPSEELEVHGSAFVEASVSSERSSNGQHLGRVGYEGVNSAAEETRYAGVKGYIVSNTNGSEVGGLKLEVRDGADFEELIIINTNEITINDGSKDVDVRIEGNNDTNLLKIDGGNDTVTVGDSRTSGKLLVDGSYGTRTFADLGSTDVIMELNNNAKLQFVENGTVFALVTADVADDFAIGTTDNLEDVYSRLYINGATGYVGIGTTGPDGELDITSAATPKVFIQTSDTIDNDAILEIRGARTTSVDEDIAQIIFATNDSASAGDELAYITARKQTSNTNEGNLLFWTADSDGATPTEKVRIDKNGNVGIGESSPAATLDVDGTLILQSGTSINEFSTDGTLSGNSDDAVPTEKATKTYADSAGPWEVSDNQVQLRSAHTGKSVYAPSHLTIGGNLTVSGTTTTIYSQELTVTDKMITVNNGEAGAGITGDSEAGIEVDRGTETNYKFVFDETLDNFRVGEDGSEQAVATREDSPVDTRVPYWNDNTIRFDTSGNTYQTIVTTSGSGQIDMAADTVNVLSATDTTQRIGVSGDTSISLNQTTDTILITSDGTTSASISSSTQRVGVAGTTNVEVTTAGPLDQVTVDVAGVEQLFIDSDGLKLASGTSINEFSTDGALAGNSDDAVPTVKAVRTYTDSTFANSEDAFVSWNASNTDIDDLLPGSTFGGIYEGVANGHVVIGIRGNDINDGFYVIDTANSGTGDYAQLILAASDNQFAYKGNDVLTTANEGTGNGLDADTVDGIEASQFVRNDQNNQVIEGQNDASPFAVKRLNATSQQVSIEFLTSDVGETTTYQGFLGIYAGNLRFSPDANLSANGYRILNTSDEGTGNGLDADTVDSLEASQFLRSDADDSGTGAILLTTSKDNAGDTTPGSGNWTFESTAGTATVAIGQNNGDATVQAFGTGTGYDLHLNPVAGTVYAGGNAVLTTANEGSGNGLDADTVDSLEANQFLRSDTTDTATGQLTFSNYTFYSTGLVLDNDISVNGKVTGGSNYAMIQVNTSDQVELGNTGMPLNILSNGVVDVTGSIDVTGEVSTTGDVTIGSGDDKVFLDNAGFIVLSDSAGYASISFKDLESDSYDCRIGVDGSDGLRFRTGGSGSDAIGMEIDSSQNVWIANGNLNVSGDIATDNLRARTSQQLVLEAGESHNHATGQTAEYVYVNAESGLQINSSPDNWVSGWGARNTATICNSNGDSDFPGNLTASGIIVDDGINKIEIIPGYGIEITKASAAGYIDFKSSSSEDFDCRIQQSSNGLLFRVGGDGTTTTGIAITSTGYVTIPSDDLRVGINNDYVYCNNGGHLDICASAGDASVDFKTSDAEDYDCRIYQDSNGVKIATGGNGSTSTAMEIDSDQNIDLPAGRISSHHSTISSSQTNLDVSNINSLFISSSSGDITISGFTGGVAGQVLHVVKNTSANNVIIEHAEGDGDQDIFTAAASDVTLSTYGGMTLVCNSVNWFEVGH